MEDETKRWTAKLKSTLVPDIIPGKTTVAALLSSTDPFLILGSRFLDSLTGRQLGMHATIKKPPQAYVCGGLRARVSVRWRCLSELRGAALGLPVEAAC